MQGETEIYDIEIYGLHRGRMKGPATLEKLTLQIPAEGLAYTYVVQQAEAFCKAIFKEAMEEITVKKIKVEDWD